MHSPTIKHRGAFVTTLLAGTFSMSISQSSLSTAYPAFMKAFGLGADTVAWLTTDFMLVMATEAGNAFVMMPSVTAGANALPNELVADGTTVTTTARQLFGSAGVMFATVLLEGMQNTLRSHAGGFAVTFAVFAGVGLIGFLLALTLPKEFVKKVA